MRELLTKHGDPKQLNYELFAQIFEELDSQKNATTNRWKNHIGSVQGAYQVQGIVHGADEIVHTIKVEVIKH